LDGGSASGTHGGFSGGGLAGFPKIDLSYVAVDQSHPRKMLTLLRPRIAFGYAGTQPGPGDRLRLINSQGGPIQVVNNGTEVGSVGPVVALNDSTILPANFVTTLGNTQLQPEKSSELEGGFDAALWNGRLSLTYTQYNKTRRNAIIPIPVAPSASPLAQGKPGSQIPSYLYNIGEVRNTGTELTWNAQVFQSRALGWNVGGNLSNNSNMVVHLNNGLTEIPLGSNLFIKPGFPLFSQFARPIVSFVDANHDGLIDPTEIRYGDSLVYAGQADPKYQLNLNTGVALLNGRLSINATFAYQNGMSQMNIGALRSGALTSLLNAPNVPLGTQAAIVSAACAEQGSFFSVCSDNNFTRNNSSLVGLIQTVNTFRFNDLSINYNLPTGFARWFRVPRMSIALQGSNLGLHTNYRGLDPNVNSFATVSGGDETADLGQIPQPRIWSLRLSLGN
jgi:outer membrane receptor protein involved in Fe transport